MARSEKIILCKSPKNMANKCPNKNKFCFVCGLFTPKNKSRAVSKSFKLAYTKYFNKKIRNKIWFIPEIVCSYCYSGLMTWLPLSTTDKEHNALKYRSPVNWLYQNNHIKESCYFCKSEPFTKKLKYASRESICYYNSTKVVPADKKNKAKEVPINVEADDFIEKYGDKEFKNLDKTSELHLITQNDFDNLVRDTNLSIRNAELLASRLQQWNLVAKDFRVSAGRKRSSNSNFAGCYKKDDETLLTYAVDIRQIFEILGHPYNPEEWRLFIDGSTKSLKAVLLHNGNKFASIPVIYGTDIKETYCNIQTILKLIEYDKHQWVVCCDLKVVNILMGLKGGFAKKQCFLCLWEGRRRDLHYVGHKWEARKNFDIGDNSVINNPLVPASKIVLPPLHIKLGIIKNFIKALDPEGVAMKHLLTFFPKLSESKIKNGKFFVAKIFG